MDCVNCVARIGTIICGIVVGSSIGAMLNFNYSIYLFAAIGLLITFIITKNDK